MPQKQLEPLECLDLIEGFALPLLAFLIVAAATFFGLAAVQWLVEVLL
jgi:hypothetical protein